MICIAFILLFFMVAPFIDHLYEQDHEQERNVNALAKESLKKEKRKIWKSQGR